MEVKVPGKYSNTSVHSKRIPFNYSRVPSVNSVNKCKYTEHVKM